MDLGLKLRLASQIWGLDSGPSAASGCLHLLPSDPSPGTHRFHQRAEPSQRPDQQVRRVCYISKPHSAAHLWLGIVRVRPSESRKTQRTEKTIHPQNLSAWPRETGLTLGSWMKLWPERVLGGSSPVVACFRHSIIVCGGKRKEITLCALDVGTMR